MVSVLVALWGNGHCTYLVRIQIDKILHSELTLKCSFGFTSLPYGEAFGFIGGLTNIIVGIVSIVFQIVHPKSHKLDKPVLLGGYV